MNWHQFLREERKRKLTTNDLLSAGCIGTSMMRNGVRIDTNQEAITTNEEHIAEIEAILAEAGEPLDA